VVVAGGLIGVQVHASPATDAAAKHCGVWRWSVKTLSDPDASDVNATPVAHTVNYLRGLGPPDHLASDTPRIRSVEFKTYRVKVQLVRAKIEDDHDVHLVVAQPGARSHTMIVEFPDTTCQGAARSAHKADMKQARSDLLGACPPIGSSDFTDLTGSATITRVGFFDEIHHQSGVAPNGIEVHPALSFSGTCSGSSTPSPSPSASASPSPSPSSGAAVEITEIQYNSPGSDDGSNASRNAEWARLHNSGGSDADLSGWTVRDTASHVYTFGSFTLAAGASVTIHTGDGTDSATDVYWGSGSYIWNNDGDTATLADSGGTVVDTCSYSDPGENYASTSC